MNKNKIKLSYRCPRTDRTYNGFLWIRVNDPSGTFIESYGASNTITPRWISWEELDTIRADGGPLDGKDWVSSSSMNCHDVRKFKKFLRKHPDLVGKCTLVHQYYYVDQSLGYSLDIEG